MKGQILNQRIQVECSFYVILESQIKTSATSEASWGGIIIIVSLGDDMHLPPVLDSTRDPPWPSGYDAWLPSLSSQVRVSAGSPSGLA